MRKRFTAVARVGEIPPGEGRLFRLENGEECVVYCSESGRHYASTPLCPHQNEPLDRGRLEGCEVICRRHHLRFDLETGECTNAFGYSLKKYEVQVEAGEIRVGYWDFDD